MEPRLEELEREINRIRMDLEPDVFVPPDVYVPSQSVELVVDRLWLYYREQVPYRADVPKRPLWRLVEDMQRQAMVYMNIIDQLKSGEEPTNIRERFEELELVPESTLPNPDGLRVKDWALAKVARYREALIDIVKRHGRTLVFDDLDFARELTPGVALELSFLPAVSISVEFSGR